MQSWNNIKNEYDAYIQWIDYSLLTNVQEMTSLRHEDQEKIADEQDAQSFDFYYNNTNSTMCFAYLHR